MKYTELKNKLRKESGIDNTKERIFVRRWIQWLKDHKDPRISNIGYGLAFGLRTGRLFDDYDGYLLKKGKRLTNLQTITIFAKAILNQNELTTAEATKAIQKELGIKIV